MAANPHIGQSFESFLRDEGLLEEVTAEAIKRAIALRKKQDESRRTKIKAQRFARLP